MFIHRRMSIRPWEGGWGPETLGGRGLGEEYLRGPEGQTDGNPPVYKAADPKGTRGKRNKKSEKRKMRGDKSIGFEVERGIIERKSGKRNIYSGNRKTKRGTRNSKRRRRGKKWEEEEEE